MMHSTNRAELRRVFVRAWEKYQSREALELMEQIVADIIAEHPEYHRLLDKDDVIEADFPVDAGSVNPFLHLSMHVAIHEQVAAELPACIRELYFQLKSIMGTFICWSAR